MFTHVLATVWLALSGVAAAGSGDRAQEAAARASEAYDVGDVERAAKLTRRALKLDPANAAARAMQAQLDGAPAPEAAASTAAPALAVPSRPVTCPADAEAAYTNAEQRFAANDMAAAKAAYEEALAGCPEQARWRVYYGDTFFRTGDLDGAEREYRAALAIDPCDPVAWRFLADVHAKRGRADETWDAVLHTVACDPTYAAGWKDVAVVARNRGGELVLPEGLPEANVVVIAEGADSNALMNAMFPIVVEQARATAVREATGSPLERARAGVLAGLELYERARQDMAELPLWSILAAARDAGRLDAAIFVLLLDRELVPEFVAWREPHVDEAMQLVSEQLVIGAAPR